MEKFEVIELNKEINKVSILNDINLSLEKGKIYGFVGQNGSGKTMLFRVLSGLVKATSGEIKIDDKKVDSFSLPERKIGIMLENAGMYQNFTGYKNLKYLAEINNNIGKNEIRESIKKVGLDPDDKRTFRKYSLGMKQRILFAQAIMEEPEILFLDEPTNALDKEGIEKIRELILEQKERNAIVLIASHNAEDISMLCDQCFYMAEGKLYTEKV